MKPADTSDEAYRRQLEVWREMTGAQRLAIAFDLSDFVRDCAKSRIRKNHPELTEPEVTRRLIFELYGV